MATLTYYLLFINLATAGLMAYDKLNATRGRWRVPESSLFLMAGLGGSPALFFLITYLRHKSNKAAFRWRLNAILGAQIIILSIALLMFS